MSYVLRDYEQLDVFTPGDSTVHIRARLYCTTVSDLPAPTDIPGFTLEAGSTAWIIGEVVLYMLDTGGAWREQRSADLSAIITDISQIRGELQAHENRIDAAENRITALETAAADLVDRGAKNLLNWSAASTSQITITDNGDGTFTASGTVPSGSVSSILLGWIYNLSDQTELYLSGCPAGGSQPSGYSLLAANTAGSLIAPDEGSGVVFTPDSGEDRIRVYVRFRAGTYSALTFAPMVTLNTFAKLSKKFVPYSPSNAELYQLIHSYHP